MFSAVAALVAGAEVTAPLVLGAMAEVGTAMSVVGAVTGNKTLTKVGGIMGLVGGVGGLVNGAMGAASAADGVISEGATDAAVDTAVDGSDAMDAAAASDAGGGAAASAPDATALDQSMGANSTGTAFTSDFQPVSNPTDTRLAAGTQSSPGIVNNAMAAPQSTPIASQPVAPVQAGSVADVGAGAGSAQAPAAAGVPDVSTPAGNVGAAPAVPPVSATPPGAITNPTDARLAAGTQMTPGGVTSPLDSTSYLQKMLSFAQDPRNKTMLQMGMKLAGGALQGAQVQSQFNQRMDLERQRLAQTSHGSEVARVGIVNGARR